MTEIRTESTFEVAATPAEAWKALEELKARATGPDEWWLPGFECRGAEVESDPQRQLTVRKLDQPCDVLLTVEGAPLYSVRELGVVERIVRPGDDVAATWARRGQRSEASATV